jgi:hypothetical protein
MKNILICIFLLSGLYSNSQSFFSDYRLEFKIEPYTNIQSDSVFFADTLWFDSSYHNQYFPYNLNNSFKFPLIRENASNWGYEIDYFRFGFVAPSYDFQLYSRPVNAKTREYSNTPPFQTKISADLDSNTVDGPVFKFELRQLGLSDSLYHVKGYLNMQYWFFQNGDIEVHYGDCLVPEEVQNVRKNGTGKFKLCFWMYQMDIFKTHYMYLTGDADNPRLSDGLNNPFVTLMYDSTLTPFPPSGTVYRFTRSFVGLASLQMDYTGFGVYPNPSRGIVHIDNLQHKTIQIINLLDVSGKSLELNPVLENGMLDLSGAESGLYFLQIYTDEGILARKIVIE